jgi:hypothetical protein
MYMYTLYTMCISCVYYTSSYSEVRILHVHYECSLGLLSVHYMYTVFILLTITSSIE